MNILHFSSSNNENEKENQTTINYHISNATEMILQAPRLHPSNMNHCWSDEEVETIEEFEDAWCAFISKNPHLLPPGKKLKSVMDLEMEIEQVEVQKHNVQMELQRQLEFFMTSKDQLDANFTRAMEEAALIQQDVIRGLNKEIDDIAIADQDLSFILPWEHFFDNLESITEENHISDGSSVTASRSLKPSGQALFLANNMDQEEVAKAALKGKSDSMLLKAFAIDNALLKAETKMLEKDADRLERTTKSQKVLSKFLMEHNIWGLMTAKEVGGGTTVGSTTISRGTIGTMSALTGSLYPNKK
jgi:hypothetical protein